MRTHSSSIIAVFTLTQCCLAGDPLDDLVDEIRQGTQFQSEDGKMSLDFDFFATVDNWVVSQPPPGIMVTGQNDLNSPRLSMLATFNANEWMSIFALGNIDRGFDPTDQSIQIRPDEYFLKLDPFDGIAKLKLGKVTTGYGQWVNRHFSWQNPLVNAPLAYEWMMGVRSDTARVAPMTATANRNTWLPLIWGPSYTSGGQINGTMDTFDYSFEIKNDALSSNPDQWDLWNHELDGGALTYTGRLGWRPSAQWTLGSSASTGSYVIPGSFNNWQDYKQTNAGFDIAWAYGHVEVWSEVNWSSYDVRPGAFSQAGTVSVLSYFVESKWKFAPSWWLAGRWNQQLPGEKPNSSEQWDSDVWRIDACVGWHLDRTVTIKAQTSYTYEQDPNLTNQPNKQGEYVFNLQFVLAF